MALVPEAAEGSHAKTPVRPSVSCCVARHQESRMGRSVPATYRPGMGTPPAVCRCSSSIHMPYLSRAGFCPGGHGRNREWSKYVNQVAFPGRPEQARTPCCGYLSSSRHRRCRTGRASTHETVRVRPTVPARTGRRRRGSERVGRGLAAALMMMANLARGSSIRRVSRPA